MRARPAVFAVAGALALFLTSTPAGPAGAAGSSAADVARQRLAAAQAQLVPAQKELAGAAAALRAAEARERAVTAELVRAQAAERRSAVAVADARAALADAQDAASLLAREVYVQGLDGTARQLSAALGSRDPGRLAAAVTLTGAFSRRQAEQIAHLAAQRAALAASEATLRAARAEVARRRDETHALVARERALVERASRTSLRVSALVAVRAAAVARAEATKRTDAGRYLELTGEEVGLQRRLAALGASTAPAVTGLGFLRPAPGSSSSPFGMRTHPITGVYKMHTGTDIASPCGTPIRATENGLVIAADYNRAYGYRTVLDHGLVNGHRVASTYNHQLRLGVGVGQVVTRGQAIGSVGTTGYSTGCHLHVEFLVDGRYVDPVPYFR